MAFTCRVDGHRCAGYTRPSRMLERMRRWKSSRIAGASSAPVPSGGTQFATQHPHDPGLQERMLQAKGIVLSFQPVVQAIVHTETQDPYMKRCNHFVILCGRASRSFDDDVQTMQGHRDLATNAGKARRTLCQQACPTNDWAHFVRQVQKRLPRRSGYSDEVSLRVLKVMRVSPTA